jgi:hypothetical protein
VVAALARATYEQLRATNGSSLDTKLLELLGSDKDRDARIFGAYGLFFLVLDDPASLARFSAGLDHLSQSSHPQTRIAANRALEMIKTSDLVEDAKRDRRLVPLARSKLNLLLLHPEIHLRVAAQVCLEEL